MDFYTFLAGMFPDKAAAAVQNIIQIVREAQPLDPDDYKLESMVNLLSENSGKSPLVSVRTNNFSNEEELLDEAAGYHYALNEDVTQFVEEDIGLSVNETLKRLIDMLPNADPSYLEKKAKDLAGNEVALEEFITNAVENNKYPTLDTYLKNREEKQQKDKYITNFHIRDFLKQFPNPNGYFNDPIRKHALMGTNSESDEKYALTFLFNHFNYLRIKHITTLFAKCNKDLVKTSNKLKKLPHSYKIPRHFKDQDETPNNIPLLQEIAFIQNENILDDLLKLRDQNYKNAKECGLLETCACCYFEELIPEECYFCKSGCIFCKDCIKRGTEISIGQQKFDILCFSESCGSEFSLSTLQMVLDDVTFKGFSENKQAEEIKRAKVDGLEYCPLGCNFAVIIPDPKDKIFHCEVCIKDTCRECKHLSHIPLKCSEVEFDEDVKMRTYIENKMSESLLRRCKSCNKVFIKSSGCNKITCSCGTIMCYLCGTQIRDYSHFTQTTCPLFTDDNKIHRDNVIRGANVAKAELGVDKNPNKLKFDPTKDITLHYD